jgi:hypothetical protein
MGHAQLQTTEIYADYVPSSHEKEMVERAFAAKRAGAREAGSRPGGRPAGSDRLATRVFSVPL